MEELRRQFKRHKFWYYWCCFWMAWCGLAFIMDLMTKRWIWAFFMLCLVVLNAWMANGHHRTMKLIAQKASQTPSQTVEKETVTN